MAEIDDHADRAEHYVDAAVEEQPEGDERNVERAIDRLAEFVAFACGDPAPERHRAEQVEPKAEVAERGKSEIERPGRGDHGDADDLGNRAAQFQVRIPIGYVPV